MSEAKKRARKRTEASGDWIRKDVDHGRQQTMILFPAYLIADDEEGIRFAMRETLAEEGYEIEEASLMDGKRSRSSVLRQIRLDHP